MTTPVQFAERSIWTGDEAAKIAQATQVAEEMRRTIDKTVNVLSLLPQITAAYPLLSGYKSTPLPVSQNVLELDNIITEISQGHSLKANFGKLGRLLLPLANRDLSTFTSEDFLNLKEVLEKCLPYSKNPNLLDHLKNPTLCAEFFQTNELPSEITEELLKSELEPYEQSYEVACQCIMLSHVNVLTEQKHLSKIDELFKLAAYSLLMAQRLPDENYPGGVVAGVFERNRIEDELEGINRVLTNPGVVQGILKNAQKIESFSQELLKSDDPEVAKNVEQQIRLKELPVDIRLKALKLLSETAEYKQKTLKLVNSLV